jgi:heterodisulfide reductase subunit C
LKVFIIVIFISIIYIEMGSNVQTTSLKEIITRMMGNERLKICQQCGKCAGDCPIAKVIPEQFNPRRLIQKITLNYSREMLSDVEIWLCAFCYRCLERCPNRVAIPEILMRIRNLSVESGDTPKQPSALVKNMIETGRVMEVLDEVEEWRNSIGLPPLRQTVSEQALNEIRKIIETTGFKRKLGWEDK